MFTKLSEKSHPDAVNIIMKALHMYKPSASIVSKILRESQDDATVVAALINIRDNAHVKPIPDTEWAKRRGLVRADQITELIKSYPNELKSNAHNMLDIGSDDGIITMAIGTQTFGLEPQNIYGIDIEQWGVHTRGDEEKKPFNFEFISETKVDIPFDVQFNRIVIMQTLHHVKDMANMMYEINRVSSPGGIVIIREHDCRDAAMSTLIDIEHMAYDVLIDNHSLDNFQKTYYGKYRSKFQWTALFEAHMFRRLDTKSTIRPGTTNYYFAMYQKIGDAKPLKNYSIDTLKSIHVKLFQRVAPIKMKKGEIVKYIIQNI